MSFNKAEYLRDSRMSSQKPKAARNLILVCVVLRYCNGSVAARHYLFVVGQYATTSFRFLNTLC